MKYVQLFEDFSTALGSENYKAISIFPEGGSDIYVGFFPAQMADQIYSKLIAANQEYIAGSRYPERDPGSLIEILDIPPSDDVVFSKLGGEGLSSTNSEDYESKTGQPLPELVQLGKPYNLDDDHIGFLVNKKLNQFIKLDYTGQTFPISPDSMIELVKVKGYK